MRWTQLYFGLGFTTLATLILELSLTRIFSVVFYYHLAFLAISIALFGLGAGGVFSYVVSARPGSLYANSVSLALANSLCVVGSLWFILSRPANPGNFALAAVYFASALPFFLAGTVVSIAISEAIERIDRAYFFDLAGAAAGCLLLIPFLRMIRRSEHADRSRSAVRHILRDLVQPSGSLPTARDGRAGRAAAGRSDGGEWKARTRAGYSMAKGQALPDEKFVAWNGISRIGVSNNGGGWSIVIDADAATGISPYDWDNIKPEDRAQLLRQGPGFPYAMRPGAKALVIGPGGGYDVARALASGSRDITAVEINPIIANSVMRGQFANESHHIYTHPGVRVFVEDGRSFVRRSDEKYQVLQATLVDTWASTAAGAFALSENNLYTADAFTDYLDHLTDDGLLAFTRWGFDPPRESLRLLSLAMAALPRVGESDPARHVMVIREDTAKLKGWGALDTVLISRKPFSDADVAHARQVIAEAHMDEIYLPGDTPKNAFGQLLTASDPEAFWRDYPFDVSPVNDDRPFFFYTVQPRDLWDYIATANRSSADYKVNRAVPLLFGLMAVSICATILILILPRLLLGTSLPKQKGVVAFLWYFICLGAGYILIQVALIQKFVLLLGHPTYALVVIVFSMLVASGAGSFFSRRVIQDDDSRLLRILDPSRSWSPLWRSVRVLFHKRPRRGRCKRRC